MDVAPRRQLKGSRTRLELGRRLLQTVEKVYTHVLDSPVLLQCKEAYRAVEQW